MIYRLFVDSRLKELALFDAFLWLDLTYLLDLCLYSFLTPYPLDFAIIKSNIVIHDRSLKSVIIW